MRLLAKEKWQKKVNDVINNYFFNKVNIKGSMSQTDKINLILSNHISVLDFLIIISALNHFGISEYYFVFKESILKIPIFGGILQDDIRISRNWETDQDLIINQVNNINHGTIIIFPEGTRFSLSKHKKSLKFCYDNKIPFYNYTLAPKAKGLHCLVNILKENNKLGHIYDFTIVMPKFINKDIKISDLLGSEKFGDLYLKINEIEFNNCSDYNEFKKQLFSIWLYKNIFFDSKSPIK